MATRSERGLKGCAQRQKQGAVALRFNCKNGNLVDDLNAKIAPKCAGQRFNCK